MILQNFQILLKCKSEMTFVAHCDVAFERINLSEIPELTNPTFLIGPEGDFSEKKLKC